MRIFPWYVFAIVIAGLAVVAALVSSALGKEANSSTATRILEGTGFAVLGGLLSWGWIWLLLWLGNGRPAVCLAVVICFLASPFVLVAGAVSAIFSRIARRYPAPGQRLTRFGVQALWAGILIAILLPLAILALSSLYAGAAVVLVVSCILIPLACQLPLAWQSSHLNRSPSAVVMVAVFVGMFSGMMDGVWDVVQPDTFPQFVIDKTWGLSGTANGATIHLNNMMTPGCVHLTPGILASAGGTVPTTFSCPGSPATGDNEATASILVSHGGHQYTTGFAMSARAAFTEGNVTSNIGIGNPLKEIVPCLIEHEYVHMAQNRIFGPLFTIIYILWFVVLLVPGFIAGAVLGIGHGGTFMANAIDGLMAYSYCNNPFEAWAYGDENPQDQGSLIVNAALEPLLLWPRVLVLTAGSSFGLLGLLMFWQLIGGVWLRRRWWIGGGTAQAYLLPRTPEATLIVQKLLILVNMVINCCIWLAMTDGFHGVFGQLIIVGVIGILGFLPSTPIARNGIYQRILVWTSVLMPTCWFGHVVALVLVVVNPIGLWLGNLWQLACGTPGAELWWFPPFSCPGPVITIAHWLQGWVFGFARLFSCAWYGAIAPELLYPGANEVAPGTTGLRQADTSRIPAVERKVLRGHQLNHAAFGVATLGRWAEEEALSFWEALAESVNEPRDRLSTPHAQGPERQHLSMWCSDRSVRLDRIRD